MNIAISVTTIRLILGIIAAAFIGTNYTLFVATLITIAFLLDIVDGKIARARGETTTFGVYYDILADKIIIVGLLLVLGYEEYISFYIGLLLFIREYMIDSMRTVAISQGTVISANWQSKIKGGMFMLVILGVVWTQVINVPELNYASLVLGWIALVFSYITLLVFFVKNSQLIRQAIILKK